MDDVERQLAAWADAAIAAAAADGPAKGAGGHGRPVMAPEVMEIAEFPVVGGGRRWVRPVLVAAVVVLLIGVAAIAVRSNGDDAEPVQSGPSTTDGPTETMSTTRPTDFPPREVDFFLLNVGLASVCELCEPSVPWLRSASTPQQLQDLWAEVRYLEPERSSVPPVPDVDFDRQVVVSIVIPDDACPPDFRGFRQVEVEGWPDLVIPQFVQPSGACREPLIPKQYVVAIDWASVGDRFTLHVDAADLAATGTARPLAFEYSNERDEPDNPLSPELFPGGEISEITLDRSRPDPTVVDIVMANTTLVSGGGLTGRVVVSNNSGEVIYGSGCGDAYWISLRNEAGFSTVSPTSDECLSEYAVFPGTTRYLLGLSLFAPPCDDDGNPPTGVTTCNPIPAAHAIDDPPPPLGLDPGRYEAVLGGRDGLPVNAPPIPITVVP